MDTPNTPNAQLAGLADWAREPQQHPHPDRAVLAAAVRASVRRLAEVAPGKSVEVRVPPFVAVQCIDGPRHTRGTPPNVVEMDPWTWVRLALGIESFAAALARGGVDASGARAGEVAHWLPIGH
ncbi:sterol carrier family protein [Corynebacterium uberis]|uniref:sterol carrier family protein n=1 Tax=Corynebacterium TaxID=1716 RepID=UPI001D0B0F05|nr:MULTISPECIES: sterol carrier family protein [Corynebacterium]MCZ9310281.1 sterol carrier family protein [Corynebacterium sp. c6VSa_13]UDL73649.1 sterol carrier family protein [Corynebacterium uberis]UDL75471.1 sterol carrier family protein [Corynebacterium uberis]UDL77684.1 sterol carrier family protein [Corynebacterium uberis]UDL79968.1 sterol carrier family protein [Corynebacterium uberis]